MAALLTLSGFRQARPRGDSGRVHRGGRPGARHRPRKRGDYVAGAVVACRARRRQPPDLGVPASSDPCAAALTGPARHCRYLSSASLRRVSLIVRQPFQAACR